MGDVDNDFCFPCSYCKAQFDSLRELRKHMCVLLKDIGKNEPNISVSTEPVNKEQIMNDLLIEQNPGHKNNIPQTKNFSTQNTAQTEISQLPADMMATMQSNNTEEKSSINVFIPIKSETNSEKYSKDCVPCQKVFSDQIMYLKHEWAHKKNKANPNICLPCIEPNCLEILPNSKMLDSHKRKAHGIQNVFTCNICSYSSTTKSIVKLHHDKKHLASDSCICTECGEGFKSRLALEYHIKKKYGVYDFKCQGCEYQTITEAQLKTHVINVHTRVFPVQCPECGKGFTHKCYMKIHMSKHTGEKKKKCKFCEISFRLNGTLRRHERIHLKIQPYKCTMCPKGFREGQDLQVHIKRHLNQKDYVCSNCKRGFIEPAGLRKHRCPTSN